MSSNATKITLLVSGRPGFEAQESGLELIFLTSLLHCLCALRGPEGTRALPRAEHRTASPSPGSWGRGAWAGTLTPHPLVVKAHSSPLRAWADFSARWE